jgi:hypothetical protein
VAVSVCSIEQENKRVGFAVAIGAIDDKLQNLPLFGVV